MKILNLLSDKILVQLTKRSALLTLTLSIVYNLVNAQAPNVTYKAPLIITKGGTYTGNYASSNSSTPAISINTSEPVIIENAIIKSAGHLIYSASRNCNIIIRNTKGYGLTPTVDNRPKGRFLQCYAFTKAIVENNYMENTAGIYIDTYKGSSTSSETIRVRYNKAKNIDGRYRNSGRAMVQFCVLNNVRRVKNIEIAWNEVINKPNESAVEDNINMHLSSGTSDSPILIHNNYIQGAYHLNLNSGYSGGGIMLADGANASADQVSSYVRAYGNHVVSTTNYGIAIAGGHDNLIYNNRVISCGYANTASGLVYIGGQNVGIYIMNITKSTSFYNNTARDNYSGWVKKSLYTGRNDYYLINGVNSTNNASISGSVTMSMETNEYNLWLQKVSSNGKKIGVQSGTTSNVAPPPVEQVSGTTKRYEAESYTELADPGSNGIGRMSVSTHSAGASVKLFDSGDKIRLSINVATAGSYIVKARVRSGYYTSSASNPTGYWVGGYTYAINGVSTTFTTDNATISAKDPSYGGSYWGTMKSPTITLKAGTNTVDIAAVKTWLGVDYIEIVPSSSAQRVASDEKTESIESEVLASASNVKFKAYPNPVVNSLTIEGLELDTKSYLTIYRSSGEPVVSVAEIDSFGDKAIIDLQNYNLIQGVYLLKVQSGNKVFEKRIFKN